MLGIAKRLFYELNNSKVKYCHFKSNEHLLEGMNGVTDLDILVAKEDGQAFERIVISLDFKRFYSQAELSYPGVDDWIGFDKDTGSLIHLHLHYQLITGKKHIKEYVLPWEKIALSTAVQDKETGVYKSDPCFELILLLTRIVLKLDITKTTLLYFGKFRLKSADAKELDFLLKDTSLPGIRQFVKACHLNEDEDTIVEIIAKNQYTAKHIKKLRQIIKKNVCYYIRAGVSFGIFRSTCRMIKYRKKQLSKRNFSPYVFTKKVPHTSGCMIVFIGPDGAGKTTVSKNIYQWLGWKFETEAVYLGSGGNYFNNVKNTYKLIRMTLKRLCKLNDIKRNNKSTKSDNEIRPSLLRQLYYLNVARHVNSILHKLNRYRLSGGLVVLDRFPQTQFEGIYDGAKTEKRYKRINKMELKYLNIVNQVQPDLVIKLRITSEVAASRKPDHNYEEIVRKVNITEELKYPRSKVYIVDAQQPLDKELIEIKRIIWSNL